MIVNKEFGFVSFFFTIDFINITQLVLRLKILTQILNEIYLKTLSQNFNSK